MSDTVYNEWFGEVTPALNRALKRYNVSPADYQDLERLCGEGNHDAILAKIKEHVDPEWGIYRAPWPLG